MDQIIEILNNPIVIVALVFLGAVLVWVVYQRRNRNGRITNPPKAPDSVALMLAGWGAIDDAAKGEAAKIAVHKLGTSLANKKFGEVADALNTQVFDPCETIQSLARHANAVAPTPAAPAAPEKCPVK